MAGYMSVLKNNVYDGRFANGADSAVANGTIMKVDTTGTKLVLPGTADTAFKAIAVEKTTIYNTIPANEFLITATGDTQYYLVENDFDINDSAEYDETTYTTAVGALLRAHPIEVGERLYADGTSAAGTAVSLKGVGTLA